MSCDSSARGKKQVNRSGSGGVRRGRVESAKSAVSLSTDISNIVPSGPAAHPAYPEGEACTRRLYCNVTILYSLFGPFMYSYSSYRYAVHLN